MEKVWAQAQARPVQWTSRLIWRLRGERTRGEFAALLQVTLLVTITTVWRWESGRSQPDEGHAQLLSELAEQERFLKDWWLGGSGAMVGDID